MPRVTQLVRVEQKFNYRTVGSRLRSYTLLHTVQKIIFLFSLGLWLDMLGFMHRLNAKGRLQPASRARQ